MSKFKKGDRVKCINIGEHGSYSVKVGEIYTITRVYKKDNKDFVEVSTEIGMRSSGIFSSRFKLLTVKNTAVARAFYKNKIEKIEKGLIYLK